MTPKTYQTFKAFYPYYLAQHQNTTCRVLHYIGSMLSLGLLIFGIVNSQWFFIGYAVFIGYGFAWVGHFFFEKNRPATFTYPLFSLVADYKMLFDFIKNKRL